MTVPQFAKGAKYLLELLQKAVEHLDLDDLANNQVIERAQRLFKGVRVSTVAGQEAIKQVETTAIKRQDKLRAKELSKNFQLRKGRVITAKQGCEIQDACEVAEQSAKQAVEEAKEERRRIANECMDLLDGVDDAGRDVTDQEARRQAVEEWEPLEDYDGDRDRDYDSNGQDHDKDLDADGEIDEEYAYAFSSSSLRGPPPQLPQEVIDFNQGIAKVTEAHQRRHDLFYRITKELDQELGRKAQICNKSQLSEQTLIAYLGQLRSMCIYITFNSHLQCIQAYI